MTSSIANTRTPLHTKGRRGLIGFAITMVTAASVAIGAAPARACSCSEWPEGQTPEQMEAAATESAAEVFIGIAISESHVPGTDDDYDGPDHQVSFDLERTIKGEPGDPVEVTVSDGDGDTCGAVFEVGSRYKVFVGLKDDGRRMTTNCAANRRASAEEVAAVESPPPTPTPSPPPETTTSTVVPTTAAPTTTTAPAPTTSVATRDEEVEVAAAVERTSNEGEAPSRVVLSIAVAALAAALAALARVRPRRHVHPD